MRWPRARISLETVLATVAVVAVNCAIGRELYSMGGYGCNRLLSRPSLCEFLMGFSPFISVALIASLRVMTRRLITLCRRRTTQRPLPCGFTFFSAHLLALACVLLFFMPDLIVSYLERLSPVFDRLERFWPLIIPREPPFDASHALEILFLGAFLSGPPLVLAFVGRVLARRCAATLPLPRFRAMAGLVSLGFAGVAFAIAETPQVFDEARDVALDFRIVDQDSGQPIAAAFVRLADPFDWQRTPRRALTGPDGRALLSGRFRCIGERTAFRTMGTFSTWGQWVEVSAPDHRAIRVPLSEALGTVAEVEGLPPRKIALVKGRTAERPFRDIAGTYARSLGMAGSHYTIEDDGRFSWSASGCTFHVEEYGYLTRDGWEIQFHPIPHAGEEVHPFMLMKHRVVVWGDRLFLAQDDDAVRRICRAALFPNRRPLTTNRMRLLHLRDFDRETHLTGLPRLPATVWARVLLGEISLRNKDGIVRQSLDRLIPARLRPGANEPLAFHVTF